MTPEQKKAYAQQYYRNHHLAILDYQRHWRANNREYLRQYNRDRREYYKAIKKPEHDGSTKDNTHEQSQLENEMR